MAENKIVTIEEIRPALKSMSIIYVNEEVPICAIVKLSQPSINIVAEILTNVKDKKIKKGEWHSIPMIYSDSIGSPKAIKSNFGNTVQRQKKKIT